MDNFESVFSNFPYMLHGGDYNPEQWIDTPEIWDEDMRLMKLANCNEMTMGIFSWAQIEPEEDEFDFSFLDTMMDKVYSNGGRVILATPSAARPHWLADKYPDVLRTNEEGVKEHFRQRHNFCPSSKDYRKRVRIINEKLSERYHNHPALIGWHLSNEYGNGLVNGFCYCDKCKANFQKWLRNKYKTIDKLNSSWWTEFWSHSFDSFEQIEPPYLEIGNQNFYGLRLDWRRFLSDITLDFMKEEIKAVKKFSTSPVTTNGMCIYPGLNYRDFAKELDFFSQDIYPEWYNGTRKTALETGLICDYSRCIKGGKPFIVMESAPGAVASGVNFRKVKSNRQQLLEAVKFVAHGSDSVMYFQWRKGRGACEKFHGAVVDHYGKEDTRVFKNVSKVGDMLKKLDCIVGSRVKSDVAIVQDTPTWWALGKARPAKTDNGYMANIQAFYNAFNEKNIQTDIIGYDDEFSKYKLLVIPCPYLMTAELAEKIKKYVLDGGILISTYLCAVTDENDKCNLGGVPGFSLSDVFGIRVEEVDSYSDSVYKNSVVYGSKTYHLNGIAEISVVKNAQALAAYTDEFYAGSGALFVNEYGKGKAYYMAFESSGEFHRDFISNIISEYNLKPVIDAEFDDGICIRERKTKDKNYYFIMNETDEEKYITLDKSYSCLLTGKTVSGKICMQPCEFYILKNI